MGNGIEDFRKTCYSEEGSDTVMQLAVVAKVSETKEILPHIETDLPEFLPKHEKKQLYM